MDIEKTSRLRSAITWAAIIAAVHFALGTRTHSIHGLHVVLGGLFLVPVLIAAVAFELRGGLLAGAGVSILYAAHILWSWRGSTLANADQWAMIGVYLVVGTAAGMLVRTAGVRKWQRDEVLRRSRRTELVQGLTGLLSVLAIREPDSLRESRRVAAIAVRIGRRLGLGEDALDSLRLASLVHDIGKVGISPDLPLRHEVLAPGEMHGHVETAMKLLQPITGTDEVARIVLAHQESPDGTGPRGLRSDAIPLEGRILRVADVFATLSAPDPGGLTLTMDQVIAGMRAMAGAKIDAGCFDALLQELDQSGSMPIDSEPLPDSIATMGEPAHA